MGTPPPQTQAPFWTVREEVLTPDEWGGTVVERRWAVSLPTRLPVAARTRVGSLTVEVEVYLACPSCGATVVAEDPCPRCAGLFSGETAEVGFYWVPLYSGSRTLALLGEEWEAHAPHALSCLAQWGELQLGAGPLVASLIASQSLWDLTTLAQAYLSEEETSP